MTSPIQLTNGSRTFIDSANKVHSGYYDYSLTVYTKNREKVKIICPVHGVFAQFPSNHLSGKGCRLCGFNKRSASFTEHYRSNKGSVDLSQNRVSIPLTKGFFAVIDKQDYDLVSKYNWCYQTVVGTNYGRAVSRIKGKDIYMHRLILDPDNDFDVDHKDRNPLHNWRSNLRLCTHQQNMMNKEKRKDSGNKYKGVNLVNNRFRARIGLIHIGYFDTEEQAAIAYNKKAFELFGEFALLNDIQPDEPKDHGNKRTR